MATIDNAPLVAVPASSGRLFDLFEMPQAVSLLLAGCSRLVDAPAVAILVPTLLTSLTSPIFISHLPLSYRSRQGVFCHVCNHSYLPSVVVISSSIA
jgi:hypothetical protein